MGGSMNDLYTLYVDKMVYEFTPCQAIWGRCVTGEN